MNEENAKPLKYLGWMNGWAENDERFALLTKCYEAKHRTQSICNNRGYERTSCPICCYEYEVDSSG